MQKITSSTDINVSDIESYFQVLNSDPREIYTARILTAVGNDKIDGLGVFHGNRDDLIRVTRRAYNEFGGTLHVLPNRTDLKGSGTKNVTSCRVLYVDIDDSTTVERIKEIRDSYGPSMIVESSPGKYHIYWRCDSCLPLYSWKEIQGGIAHLIGGDPKLGELAHSIRVPGVPRICKDGSGYIPRIVYLNPQSVELTYTDIFETFQGLTTHIEESKKLDKRADKLIKRLVAAPKKASELGEIKSRNETIYRCIQELTLITPGLTESDAVHRGLELNSFFPTPLEAREAEKASQQGYKYGCQILESNQERLEELHTPEASEPDLQERYLEDPEIKLNPWTNEALLARVKIRQEGLIVRTGDFLYAFDSDARVWRSQARSQELLHRFAKEACHDLVTDPRFKKRFGNSKNPEAAELQIQAAQEKYKSAKIYSDIVSLIKSYGAWPRKNVQDFDNDVNKLFIRDAVLDLSTGKVTEAEPEDYLLQHTGIEPVPGAKCERWLAFLGEVFSQSEDSEEMIRFLQEVFGYSLTGRVDERVLFLHVGGGANGKSTVLRALRLLAGGYSSYLNCASFSKAKNSVTRELERIGAKIEGKRVVILDDLETESQWNDSYVKNLTSDEIISRRLYAEEQDIPNRAKFHIGCNSVPTPEGQSHAMLRRLCIIPYSCRFEQNPGKERELKLMMQEELSGILNWSLRGLQRVIQRENRLQYPADVFDAIGEYKETNFKTETVLDQLFVKVNGHIPKGFAEEEIAVAELTEEVNKCLEAENAPTMSAVALGLYLKEKMHYKPFRKTIGRKQFRCYRVIKNLEKFKELKLQKNKSLLL